MDDPYDLKRFVAAQNQTGDYDAAIKELRAGRKETHWIWYVFPQMRGLGGSGHATRYGIGSGKEADAYLRHDVLGPRLHQCTQLVLRSPVVNSTILMGSSLDALKLKSSMTLFAQVADHDEDFVAVLRKYFQGGRDLKTLELLKATDMKAANELDEASSPKERGFWSRFRSAPPDSLMS